MVDMGNITTPNAADLNAAARAYCTMQGWAMPGGSYPIRPANNHGADDATNAVKAVGRGGADHDAIRRFVIKRLHAIGLTDQIPDNWKANGALTEASMRSLTATETATGTKATLYRVAADLELKPGGDGRTVHGIAVPYNKVQQIDDTLVESFDPHAFDHQMRAMYRVGYWNLHSVHGGTEVGHIKEAHNDAAGLFTESYIARGEDGDRTIDEIKSGKKPDQSIGFDELIGGTQYRGGVSHRIKANLLEVAAIPQGAYGSAAAIMGVRSAVVHGDICPTCGHSPGYERLTAAQNLLAGLPRF